MRYIFDDEDFEYDRTWTNNYSDGKTFYGIDDEDGTTAWYDEYGNLDCVTKTPTDDEQDRNYAGY